MFEVLVPLRGKNEFQPRLPKVGLVPFVVVVF